MSNRDLNKNINELFPQNNPDSCRVCNEEVVDKRWNYCSERCRKIAKSVQKKFIWEKVREKVKERDNYICQDCGVTREELRRGYYQTKELIRGKLERMAQEGLIEDEEEYMEKKKELEEKYDVNKFKPESLHVDHIKPISKGGHKFDEKNLQTLCKNCHIEKTRKENSDQEEKQEIGLEEFMDDDI